METGNEKRYRGGVANSLASLSAQVTTMFNMLLFLMFKSQADISLNVYLKRVSHVYYHYIFQSLIVFSVGHNFRCFKCLLKHFLKYQWKKYIENGVTF